MALRTIRIGGNSDIIQYDDGDYDKSIEVDDPIKVNSAPVHDEDVLRKVDMPGIGEGVSSDANIPDNAVVRGDGGAKKIQSSAVSIDDAGKESIPGGTHIGGAANYLDISDGGVLTLAGTAERKLSLRPGIDFTTQIAHAKPTQVTIGIFKGFSFPIYAVDDEELFLRQCIPGRWNGTSDILFCAGLCLSAAEDVGDYFKFRLSWEHTAVGEEVPITSNDVDVEQAVLIGRSAQYSMYKLDFVIDYDIDGVGNEIKDGELLAGRVRRLDATNPDVSNEIILLNWATVYNVDKMYKAP